jgi:transcriptional regulator with XRE-family HTH domain
MELRDTFHLMLRAKREEKGMSDEEVASLVSLSSMEYYDLEHDRSEWRTVVPFIKTKVLIKLFDIDITETFEAVPVTNSLARYHTIPDIIKDRRAALGLSSEEFADKAGFFPVFATIVEEHYLGLELWPIEVAKLVAEALEVSPEELILWIVNH